MSSGALIAGALALGFASSPHCGLMCGSACAALSRGGRGDAVALHAGRLAGYAAAGAVAAASMGALGRWAQMAPMLQPLWSALHAALLVWGLWLLATGRLPAFWGRLSGRTPDGWQRMRGPVRKAGIGVAWVALPCGMLQSALLLAALANGPLGGASVMAAFWLGAGPVLWLAPALWLRLASGAGGGQAVAGAGALARGWPVRLAGAAVAASSAWVLAGGLISRAVAWCLA
ncbi:MAG: sulfite exporter TauE/SafE family protein [Aquincola tertiaricarbonis]